LFGEKKMEMMECPVYTTIRLVKGEDLNHHGTLFAGRTAEWFVESGFIAAASQTKPENIVCLKIHGMTFTHPIQKGDLVTFKSRIVLIGKTRIVTYIEVTVHEKTCVRGFITFVHVGLDGNPLPHGLKFVPQTDEEKSLNEEAKTLS
jgi:acyl-CoA hydrolase